MLVPLRPAYTMPSDVVDSILSPDEFVNPHSAILSNLIGGDDVHGVCFLVLTLRQERYRLREVWFVVS
jgi:hypothetical protein